jgi:hypothetical protein
MTIGRYFNGLNLDALWLNNCEKIIIKQIEDDKEILIIKLGNAESKIYLPKEIASKQMAYSERIDKIGGLTIDFGDNNPTEFTATNGNVTYTYEVDTAGIYIAQGVFEDSDYITITPTIDGKRMRIHSIMFGIGFQFTNKELISTKRVNEIDHLSRELPKKTFEFTIENYSHKWSMDNPKSYARSLEEMQIVSVTYGRELPNGSIYKIPSGYMALQSWSNTSTTASFKAVGFLDYSNTIYYGGAFILYVTVIWTPTLTGIALLFGIGNAFDSIVSLVAY